MAAVVVGGWSSCTLKGAKDEAEAALRKESERSAALEGKVKDLAKTQATMELKIRDLEREKALLAERKVEPVKVEESEGCGEEAGGDARQVDQQLEEDHHQEAQVAGPDWERLTRRAAAARRRGSPR